MDWFCGLHTSYAQLRNVQFIVVRVQLICEREMNRVNKTGHFVVEQRLIQASAV